MCLKKDASARQILDLSRLTAPIALLTYNQTYGRFPPAFLAGKDGTRMHSWRVLILPFLEQNDLYNKYKFDEPWNGPNNIKLVEQMPQVYHCPMAPRGDNTTSYVAVVGDETMWAPDRAVTRSDIPDGASRLELVEIANSKILWTEPRDLSLDEAVQGVNGQDGKGIVSPHQGGANAVQANAQTFLLRNGISSDNLRAIMTMTAKDNFPWKELETLTVR